MRKLITILLLFIGSSSVWAQAPRVDRINIVAKGIYQTEITKRIDDPNQATGQRQIVSNIKLSESTSRIPARNPIDFGFQYTILGAPNGAHVSFRMVTIYPKEGLQNPETHETTFRDEYMIEKTIGPVQYKGYKIAQDWQAVPGVWTFQVWYRNRKVAEQSFTLVKP